MATFLTTLDTSSHIEKVIQHSQRRVTLITPYLQVNQHLMDRLREADRRGVDLYLVFGKNQLRPEEMGKLRELTRLKLYFLDRLHAKCYANERHIIISSMNLYEFSEKNNREMSVLVSAEDGEAFVAARREIESIISAAVPQQPEGGFLEKMRAVFAKSADASLASPANPSPPPRSSSPARPSAPPKSITPPSPQKREGTCIRCGGGIRYQPRAPLCGDCYDSWSAWRNEDYPEKKCHRCAKAASVSKGRPLCPECFRQDPFTRTSS